MKTHEFVLHLDVILMKFCQNSNEFSWNPMKLLRYCRVLTSHRKPGKPEKSADFCWSQVKVVEFFLENGKIHGKVMEFIPWFLGQFKAILAI